MKQSYRIFLSFIALLFIIGAQAGNLPRYGIPSSEVRKLSSELTGSDYEILVWLPHSYVKETDKKYPVIYILDGQWDFSTVEASIRNNFVDGAIPEVILVGISFGGSMPEHLAKRTHDCLPTKLTYGGSSKGGGAPKFLQFIKEAVIPLIESNYRVDDSYRVLGGSSYAGLFTLYTMMMETDLFDAYIALSPSLSWDDGWLLSEQKRRAEEFQSMKTRLWLGVGSEENPRTIEGTKAFYEEVLKQSDGFQLGSRILEGEGHASMKAAAYSYGLRFAFGHLNKPVDQPQKN